MLQTSFLGPGLAFVVFPEGLSMMPFAPLWCVLFFLMMCTLGFGSEVSKSMISSNKFDFIQQKKNSNSFRLWKL